MAENPRFSFTQFNDDKFVSSLNQIILYCVRVLAALMTIVIIWALLDVVYHFYVELFVEPFTTIFQVGNIFELLGGFLAVLIAVEVFLNIIFYLKEDSIHVPLVLATALTAVSRKVIVLDYQHTPVEHIYATAALVLAVGVAFYLVNKK